MNFNPFPKLESSRLFLKRITASDAEEILFLRSDKTVNKYIERPEDRKTKNVSDVIKFIKELDTYLETNKSVAWGIRLKNEPKLIGSICLWNFSNNNKIAEVGYDLHPKFHNKGIMSEALKMIIDYGFNELKLDKIEAFTHSKNESSKKLLEKNGFLLNENRKDVDHPSNIIFELENTKTL